MSVYVCLSVCIVGTCRGMVVNTGDRTVMGRIANLEMPIYVSLSVCLSVCLYLSVYVCLSVCLCRYLSWYGGEHR